MTDRQRAFLAAIIYVYKNDKFFNWHRIGVKRLPDGAKMYEFNGELKKLSMNLQDERYNKMIDLDYRDDPFTLRFHFIGRRDTDLIKLIMPEKSNDFRGEDGDLFKYEGRYYSPSDQVEIRDFSQDKDKYLYRIIW